MDVPLYLNDVVISFDGPLHLIERKLIEEPFIDICSFLVFDKAMEISALLSTKEVIF